jgi:hypothetical protein
MTAAVLVRARCVSPVATGSPLIVRTALRDIHHVWMRDTLRWLAPTLSPSADFWDGWNAIRYINDQFDRKYRWQRTLVKAILPLLRPADAFLLRSATTELELMRRHLNRVAGRRNTTEVVAAASCRFLELLSAWFKELQRVTEGLTGADLPPQARRALARLESAVSIQTVARRSPAMARSEVVS